MTEWYEQPYKGGPMAVQAAHFPRPLYPPDAAPGHTPSKDGPDVLAYKRTLCRLGRWEPWDPPSWDDSYSNAFSHGRGTGNVGDSGIEGFQRQMNVQATGWIGPETFNKLASCRVPAGRENEGDMAMDHVSVDLIEEAFEIYGGEAEPPAPPEPEVSNPRELLVAHFAQRDGYTEQPAESNCDDRDDGIRTAQDKTAGSGTWLRGEPWCGCWCYYALDAAGVTGMASWMASVASIEDRARDKLSPFKGWTTDRSQVKAGDLVVIGGYGVHVETVRGFSGSYTLTWGGNTSAGTSGSQSNGGGSYQRSRYPSEVRGYALVRFPGE